MTHTTTHEKDFGVPSVEASASPQESSMAGAARREVAPPMEQKASCKINGYELLLTCGACPEQYDVLKDGERIGYLRLRHGYFRADYPDCGGETVYEAEPDGDGEFFDYERGHFLTEAVVALDARLHRAGLSEDGEEFYSCANRFEQDGSFTASSVSDEHAQHENPKGLSPQGAGAVTAGQTPVLPPPVSAGELGELIAELMPHPLTKGPVIFQDPDKVRRALQSLQQKLKEAEAERNEARKGMNFYFNLGNKAGARADAAESTVEQMAKALEPFALLREAYSRPRIAVAPEDTIIYSSRGVVITLADLDTALSALSLKKENALAAASCTLRDQGKAYPRTCKVCGLGPCQRPLLSKGSEQSTGQGKGEE